MLVSIIAAMDRNGVIGNDQGMPWHLPRDLRRFRDITMGKPVIMGRRTLDSLGGRRLKGRYNIILSRRREFSAPGCVVARTIQEALDLALVRVGGSGSEEVMVIGGGIVFEEMMPVCDRAYLTLIEGEFVGDTFFPTGMLRHSRWSFKEREYWQADEKNPYPYWFAVLDRIKESTPPPGSFDLSSWPREANLWPREFA